MNCPFLPARITVSRLAPVPKSTQRQYPQIIGWMGWVDTSTEPDSAFALTSGNRANIVGFSLQILSDIEVEDLVRGFRQYRYRQLARLNCYSRHFVHIGKLVAPSGATLIRANTSNHGGRWSEAHHKGKEFSCWRQNVVVVDHNQELGELTQNPPAGTSVELKDEANLHGWKVNMEGPSGSPFSVRCLCSNYCCSGLSGVTREGNSRSN